MRFLTLKLLILLLPAFLQATPRIREVNFKSGKYLLKGTLVTSASETKRIPAIIFCVGSSESSYGQYKSFLKYFFEENFSLDEVALFYFEKRGVGQSEGNWATTDFEERAADAVAAANFLKTQGFIDPNRIIVAGHSQGGWIAQICVARYPDTFAGGISLAGPTFSVRRQVVNDLTSKLRCSGLDSLEAVRKAEARTRTLFSVATVLPVNKSLKQLKVIRNFEPSEYLKGIDKPFLFLFGTTDPLVDLNLAQQSLNHTFPNGIPAHFEVKLIANANHSFRLSDPCSKGTVYSEDAKHALNRWYRSRFMTVIR